MVASIYRAPEKYPNDGRKKIFLAGSIEMGNAIEWQEMFEEELKNEDVIILNPRRLDWDSSWEQTMDNPLFVEQVDWELSSLDDSDIIVMFIDPNTKSPITLIELGLHVKSGKLVVCCPEGFWKKGNVDITCNKYGAKNVQSIEELIKEVKKLL
jgi:nucleoside 2-deoxyribosyltransferase